ncbi:MAG TPA: STAS domain-containing protein [Candidatus Cybelea sp.]|jgi:anti-anti-sigma factor|nr:STAS domain-containing protein [Candidatus Cybelea sp.]
MSGSIETVRLSGELEISRKREIRDAFTLPEGAAAVLVDLSEVTYADSTALTELLRFCVTAQRDRIPLAVVIRTRQFARLVQYAGLAGAFEIFEDRNDALAYLNERVNP